MIRFSRVRANFPDGLLIAGVSVGGLDRAQAGQKILQAYSLPIELRYNGAPIQMQPNAADFQLDLDSMLALAEIQRTKIPFWQNFWEYLWGRSTTSQNIPLSSTISEPRLRIFLEEISRVYNQPPLAAQPLPGTVNFTPGESGLSLDQDGSVLLIERALKSLTNRVVELPIQRTSPPRPAFNNLEILLQQTIKVSDFDGLVGFYLSDLQTAQEIHFAYRNGELLPVEPDVAFTASSIMKIPIMVSAFKNMDTPDEESLKLMEDMIVRSGNEAADWLMKRVIDVGRAPLAVSADMQSLGLVNTFLAGYFTAGSVLLEVFETPANQRSDINTDPDPYSQTTPSDIGMLLTDLYQCAQNGGGSLPSVYPGAITQAECKQMVNYLVNNRLPSLLSAGVPDGTQVAHKHGWVSVNGIINTVGDAAITYTPGGNYVIVAFVYHPDQVIWDSANNLIASMAQAAYNFYNIP